jgi:hypothetical protein
MSAKPHKPLLVNLAWCAALLILPLGYLASYPPAIRMTRNCDMPAYRPAQWIIDKTPASDAYLRFSYAIGCGLDVYTGWWKREAIRQQSEAAGHDVQFW